MFNMLIKVGGLKPNQQVGYSLVTISGMKGKKGLPLYA